MAAPSQLTEVRVLANGDLTPGLPVRYENLNTARLAELRQRENLDAVVAGAADEFQAMLLLKDWVGIEIHDALVQATLGSVVAVKGAILPGHDDPDLWPQRTAEVYYYLRVHLNADQLTAPDEPPFDRFNDMVEWQDNDTVMWEASAVDPPYPKERLTSLRSSDAAEFTRGLNQVHITKGDIAGSAVPLQFAASTKQFLYFQLRELAGGSADGPWRSLLNVNYSWTPLPSAPILQVRAVNNRGVTGPAAVLEARFATSTAQP